MKGKIVGWHLQGFVNFKKRVWHSLRITITFDHREWKWYWTVHDANQRHRTVREGHSIWIKDAKLDSVKALHEYCAGEWKDGVTEQFNWNPLRPLREGLRMGRR